jgi:GDP-L-fucose synthase
MNIQPEPLFSLEGKRILVAGHNGMVGSAIVRRLEQESCKILTINRSEVDLRRQVEVEDWMSHHKPEIVFGAAAKVGGILANETYPAEFLHDNLAIDTSMIEAACKSILKCCTLFAHGIKPGSHDSAYRFYFFFNEEVGIK